MKGNEDCWNSNITELFFIGCGRLLPSAPAGREDHDDGRGSARGAERERERLEQCHIGVLRAIDLR